MTPPFEYLELLITLRCNFFCKNCIRLCNSEDVTGLNYDSLDMRVGHVRKFINDVKAVHLRTAVKPVVHMIVITGGEPTLHPDIAMFANMINDELVSTGLANGLCINSNIMRKPAPEIERWVVNFTPVTKKHVVHTAVLLAPTIKPQFDPCGHYRKWRVEVSVHGYSLCCASGGYIRLFGLSHLYSQNLPDHPSKFEFIPQMNDVCQHCAFGGAPVQESEIGRPVSPVYAAEVEKNKGGVRITSILPEALDEPLVAR